MAMLATGLSGAGVAHAQIGSMGQGAMAPAAGIANRAVAGLQNLNQNGPGWMYFGVNPADRGLGYNGGYMTLGGFIPYAEDDLGGFWAADLRGHLSEYGGFFSNVGAVRKQFLGGTLLGVGVYWDYDGDQNQYPTGGLPGTEQFGQFGHSYNQVGVSGEWLTDYGNLRSNGYIPVGSTAYTVGNPGNPFFQNYIMCQNGLDAALTGADLEVGAYVPGLSDWAGMISVGGYALGNSRYDWSSGPLAGQNVVPWFGGVYTRLDMTFIENWDFSIQYNNDSYFDSTGFVRLTYRMGGSRRRNVPDQVEQPMMRNEHIVRAHQTPVVATNPSTGDPWRVFHVDNAMAAGGTGTAEAPFTTLAQADTAANAAWDIVYVHQGLSRSGTPYAGTFEFNQANQYLLGSGAPFALPTVSCGQLQLSTATAQLPLLSNPTGTSIRINGAAGGGGAAVANLDISGSATGISATGNLSSGVRGSVVDNVAITGSGAGQSGVVLTGAGSQLDGAITFTDTQVTNATAFGILVDGSTKGTAKNFQATFNGTVETSNATNIIRVQNTTGGSVSLATGNAPSGSSIPNAITANGGGGIELRDNTSTTVRIGNVSLSNTSTDAINLSATSKTAAVSGTTIISADNGTGISHAAAGSAISINGFDASSAANMNPTFSYTGPITNSRGTAASSSFLTSITNVGATADITVDAPAGSVLSDTGDGIYIENVLSGGKVNFFGRGTIASSGANGILINNSSGIINVRDFGITGASGSGVSITNAQAGLAASFAELSINLAGPAATGLLANSSAANAYILSVTGGGNSIITSSSAQPAVSIESAGLGKANLGLNFDTIKAGTPAVGPAYAMEFGKSTSGAATVTGSFTVANGAVQGTEANNIDNQGSVTIVVPP